MKFRSPADQAAAELGVTIPELGETIDEIGRALDVWVDRPGIMLAILLQCAWELVKGLDVPEPEAFFRARVEEVFKGDSLHIQ